MLKKYGILAPGGKYFGCEFLAKAMNTKVTLLSKRVKKIDCKNLFIIGMRGLSHFAKYFSMADYNTVAVIFSDTNFCVYHKNCNKIIEKYDLPVYAMPDLHDYLQCEYVPAFQTIKIPDNISKEKNDKITICHSPGKKGVSNIKGTKQIAKVIRKLKSEFDIEYIEITNKDWIGTIKEKAKSHIFIDQLTYKNPNISQKRFGGIIRYNGAVGKSGLEGMLLDCCVISGAKLADTSEYFPNIPVVLTDYYKFYSNLKTLIEDDVLRNNIIQGQKEWASKYISAAFVVKNLTRHLQKEQKHTIPAPDDGTTPAPYDGTTPAPDDKYLAY